MDRREANKFGLTTTEYDAATVLGELVQAENYPQLYRQVTDGHLVASDFRRAQSVVGDLPSRERFLLELFGLGAWTKITAGFVDVTTTLIEAGLVELHRSTSMIRTSGWVMIPVLGGHVMTGIPANYQIATSVGASAYVGQDSIMLAASLGDPRGRRVLDLGCGSGLQGLLAARGAKEVVLTDIDEFSLMMTRLNAVINRVEQPISIRHGEFYKPVDHERFDTILVLPPYVPSTQGSATSKSVDGGPDGLEFVRTLLRGAAGHLSATGELLAICQLLCNDDGPLILNELEELCPELEVRISATNWHPLQPYALELSTRLVAHGAGPDVATLLDRYLRSLRSFGVTGVCTADIRARKGRRSKATARIVGNIPRVVEAMVPTTTGPISTTKLGELTTLEHRGSQIVLNGPTASLLGATDGRSNIAGIVDIAWNLPLIARQPEQRADLIDQAIERFIELERLGVVSLSEP